MSGASEPALCAAEHWTDGLMARLLFDARRPDAVWQTQLAKLARQCVAAAAASAAHDDSTTVSQKSAAAQKSALAVSLDAVAEPESEFERAVIALLGGASGAWTCVRTCDTMVGSKALR